MTQSKTISSLQNPFIKRWTKILRSPGIEREGAFFIMGERIIQDFLARPSPYQITEIVGVEGMDYSLFKGREDLVYKTANSIFQTLDILNTKFPLVVLQLPQLPVWDSKAAPSEIELFIPFQDPANVGASIRSAVAFKCSKIILLRESASPFLPRSIRASAGCVLSAPLFQGPSIHELQGPFVSFDIKGKELQSFTWPRHVRLLLGEEGKGVPAALSADRVRIAMAPECESLNATIAASIALYSYRSIHRLAN